MPRTPIDLVRRDPLYYFNRGVLLGPLVSAPSILPIACPVKVFLLTRTCGGIIRMFVIRLLSLAVSHSSRLTSDRSYISMCHAINTRVLIYNANKAVNPYRGVIVLLS